MAKEIWEGFRQGKLSKRNHDLTAEKYLWHIIGEGDGQWADVINGTRVAIPPNMGGGIRITRNLEDPIVRHFIAYHTAQKFQLLARPKADREARDRAKLDTLLANDIIHRQRLNQVVAETLFWGAAYGHGIIHAMWREDLSSDPYEPLYNTGYEESMRPGFVDMFCGDPWDTVYNPGARRYSVQWYSYGRVLPAQIVREAFAHVPGIENLEGREDLPSASRTQRIARKWEGLGSYMHGNLAMTGGLHGEEMIALVCREIAPGASRQYPKGALQIVAIDGAADTDTETVASQSSRAFLLHSGPLPGSRFSGTRFYASTRGDDVLGQPYVANIDKAQTDLNQLLTNEVEYLRRFARPPLKVPAGALVDDSITTEDDALLEFIDPQYLNAVNYLYPPAQGAGVFGPAIERAEEYIFRASGWQAASRGEAKSGDPAAKVVALARADDTIQGPIQEGIRNSLCELLQTGHALVRENLQATGIPWLIRNVTGEDLGYLAEPYIRASQLSDEAPDYIVVSGMGATPEARAQQLLSMVQMMGADQKPILTTDKMWKYWPDQTLAPPEISARDLRESRAQKVNYAIKQVAGDLRQAMGPQADLQLFQAHAALMAEFPPLLDDPDDLHVETLSNLTQDEMEDSLVRRLATMRQRVYIQRLQMKQMQQAAMQQPQMPPAKGAGPAQQPQQIQPAPDAGLAGTVTSEAMSPGAVASDVESLTRQAKAMAIA